MFVVLCVIASVIVPVLYHVLWSAIAPDRSTVRQVLGLSIGMILYQTSTLVYPLWCHTTSAHGIIILHIIGSKYVLVFAGMGHCLCGVHVKHVIVLMRY